MIRDLKRIYNGYRQYKRRDISCKSLPTRLWIEPTNACNLSCPICPNRQMKTSLPLGFMDMDTYEKVIDEAKGFAIDINLFMRGEPLLNKQIVEMIKRAKDKGLRVRLETNATLLDKETTEGIMRSGLDFISFSFDGYTKDAYESIRQGGSFDTTKKNILEFLKIKKDLKAKKPYTLVQIIETKRSEMYVQKHEKKDFIEQFNGLPVNDFRIIKPHRFGGRINKDITGSDYAYGGEIKSKFLKVRYTPCPYLWFALTVLWDGTIVPCCVNFFNEYPLGSINEISLKKAWNCGAMQALRMCIRDKAYEKIKMCADCDFLWQKTFFGISVKNIRDSGIFFKEALSGRI